MAKAEQITETVVKGITLTLTVEEADAILYLLGEITDGWEECSHGPTAERHMTNDMYKALISELDKHPVRGTFKRSVSECRISLKDVK